jgi:hypothetical protein
MSISQIFQYLTRKQINNSLTIVPVKSAINMFLESKNVASIAVFMYNSMVVQNRPDYFKYRDTIAHHMNVWIWKQKMPTDDIEYSYAEYLVKRLNNDFIESHRFLIKRVDVMYTDGRKIQNMRNSSHEVNNDNQPDTFYTVMPENVYNDKFKIVSRDNSGNLLHVNKLGKDMMPGDYQNWDVWKKQETYADFDFDRFRSFRGKYGYVNDYKTIPRNVDRDPETFGLVHRDPFRASLENETRAYDNDEYFRAKGIKK